mmetsp:Transcript_15498/g.47128  ORF Transcript_15498/g.47128 Transcript_15498/m.47128 type:complete len:215 (-) Transcript_15498:175-819(-)
MVDGLFINESQKVLQRPEIVMIVDQEINLGGREHPPNGADNGGVESLRLVLSNTAGLAHNGDDSIGPVLRLFQDGRLDGLCEEDMTHYRCPDLRVQKEGRISNDDKATRRGHQGRKEGSDKAVLHETSTFTAASRSTTNGWAHECSKGRSTISLSASSSSSSGTPSDERRQRCGKGSGSRPGRGTLCSVPLAELSEQCTSQPGFGGGGWCRGLM